MRMMAYNEKSPVSLRKAHRGREEFARAQARYAARSCSIAYFGFAPMIVVST